MVTNRNPGVGRWYGRLFSGPTDGRTAGAERPERLRIALPSRHEGFDFHADFRIAWRWQVGPPAAANPLFALHEHLRELASKITSEHALTHHAEVQDLVRIELGCPQWVTQQIVLARVDEFSLHADEAAVQRIAAHEAEWHHGRLRLRLLEEELREVDFLRQAILGEPGRARSWWLKRHPDDLRTISDDTFDEIAARVGPRVAASSRGSEIAAIVHELLRGLDPTQSGQLLALLERALRDLERHDLAIQLRPLTSEDAVG